MKIVIEIPEQNIKRLNLQVGDGMLVNKSPLTANRLWGKIVSIEKDEGGGFRAG
jgi:hypothetical protein